MKTLITGDLHLASSARDAYRHKAMEKLVREADKTGVEQTIILGDLTEEKDLHSDRLVNRVVYHVAGFAELGPVYVLQGNHDAYNDPDTPFFGFLNRVPNVRWVGTPMKTKISGLGQVMFLPFTRNYKDDWDQPLRDAVDCDFIFAHNTFEGADVGHGRKLKGIDQKIFPAGPTIISGDIHVPQKLGRVTYVGSPYAIDFGDEYLARYLIIEKGKVKSVPFDSPQKRLLEVSSIKALSRVDDLLPGDVVKVRFKIARDELTEWPRIRDEVRAWAEKVKISLHATVPEVVQARAAPAEERVRVAAAKIKDDATVATGYAKREGVDAATRKLGLELL